MQVSHKIFALCLLCHFRHQCQHQHRRVTNPACLALTVLVASFLRSVFHYAFLNVRILQSNQLDRLLESGTLTGNIVVHFDARHILSSALLALPLCLLDRATHWLIVRIVYVQVLRRYDCEKKTNNAPFAD